MVSFDQFVEKISIFEKREKFVKFSGLGAVFSFIDDMSWLNKILLKIQIWWKFSGVVQAGYLELFEMHKTMRRVLDYPPQPSLEEEKL